MDGTEFEIRLFADDCVCYRQIDSIEDTSKLQKDINQLGKWARKLGMRFQPVKCNIMQLTRKRIKKRSMQFTPYSFTSVCARVRACVCVCCRKGNPGPEMSNIPIFI